MTDKKRAPRKHDQDWNDNTVKERSKALRARQDALAVEIVERDMGRDAWETLYTENRPSHKPFPITWRKVSSMAASGLIELKII